MRRIAKTFTYLVITLVIVIIGANTVILLGGNSSICLEPESCPSKNVALVLGTSKLNMDGQPNQFFENRLTAAFTLYQTGTVKHIIVSGDNRSKYYNEPRDMFNRLIELGVPKDAITLDYAGLRTLDSIIRCKLVFGENDVIIVTQKYHGYRALWIAKHHDINAVIFAAKSPEDVGNSVYVREWLARPLALIDLYLLNRQPKHLGDKIELTY
jgi:SanA protein